MKPAFVTRPSGFLYVLRCLRDLELPFRFSQRLGVPAVKGVVFSASVLRVLRVSAMNEGICLRREPSSA
jgi:hypothetical protein